MGSVEPKAEINVFFNFFFFNPHLELRRNLFYPPHYRLQANLPSNERYFTTGNYENLHIHWTSAICLCLNIKLIVSPYNFASFQKCEYNKSPAFLQIKFIKFCFQLLSNLSINMFCLKFLKVFFVCAIMDDFYSSKIVF